MINQIIFIHNDVLVAYLFGVFIGILIGALIFKRNKTDG